MIMPVSERTADIRGTIFLRVTLVVVQQC
jgi:hypothetical protein